MHLQNHSRFITHLDIHCHAVSVETTKFYVCGAGLHPGFMRVGAALIVTEPVKHHRSWLAG